MQAQTRHFCFMKNSPVSTGHTNHVDMSMALVWGFPLHCFFHAGFSHGGMYWFFRDFYGYISESEVAHILEEWYALVWWIETFVMM